MQAQLKTTYISGYSLYLHYNLYFYTSEELLSLLDHTQSNDFMQQMILWAIKKNFCPSCGLSYHYTLESVS